MSKKKIVRTGIVGAGFSASFHFEALKKVYNTDVEVAGVFDITKERRKEYAEKRGIKAFDSLEALIDDVDVVHVCTTATAHELVTIAALEKNKFTVVEKPLTGYFGNGADDFNGGTCSKQEAFDQAVASVQRMLDAEKKSEGKILYAENWVYAPAIQKEREIIEKTGAQVLWQHGEESHSGSHSATYGYWKYSGGGSMMGKGCHPLTAALYLKRIEGKAHNGKPIRPETVSSRIHTLTSLKNFRDEGHIRSDYYDIEDFSLMHIVFEDGTIADIFASEIVSGGVHNWLEVVANNHRTICNINPNTAMQTYNPVDENFKDIYIVEKISTSQGWTFPSPDEDWFTGYQQEIEAFYRTIAYGEPLESDSSLAADCISAIYSAYISAEKDGAEVKIKRVG